MNEARLGIEVKGWQVPPRPDHAMMTGRLVRLEPLNADAHAFELHAAFQGHDALWDYMPYGPFTSGSAYHRWAREREAGEDPRFFVLRDAGEPLAMGAYKPIDTTHAEIKSMHVLTEARGRGLSKAMLDHLISAARAEGFTRLSLETGVQPTFVAARALYGRAGFQDCPPFEGYSDDPNSVFMTKVLA